MLQEYFDKLKHVDGKPSWLFDPKAVVEKNRLFAFHPAVQELHAYVLDDENTSNHHFLITAEPLAGCVFSFLTTTIHEWYLRASRIS